jgi:hypothetical protein
MKNLKISLIIFTILFFAVFTAVGVKAQGAPDRRLLTVNDTNDTNDTNIADGLCLDANGKCTLRAAIDETNARSGGEFINFALPVGSVINLTIGELSIRQFVNIIGPGSANLTVQRSPNSGTPQFRIFRVQLDELNSLPIPSMIRGLTLKNGNTASDGGAVFIYYQNIVEMTDVAVTNNTATSGGGIFNAGTLFLKRSLISSNSANGLFSGGIVNVGLATSVISDSTLTNNSGNQGGAIYNAGSLTLVNNTISHNSATTSGSSIANGATGTVNVLNTIIGMDTSLTVSSLAGNFNSLGNNLITDARNSTGFTNGTNGDQVSNNNAINPLLGDLADNGGTTQTRALLSGSPAIDHGNGCVINVNCPSPIPTNFFLLTDQRKGFRRNSGSTVDVGAFEAGSSSSTFYVALTSVSENTRLAGSFNILTRASNSEKLYASSNQFSNFRFDDLTNEFYIFEVRSKRANTGYISYFNLEDFIFPDSLTSLSFDQDNRKFAVEKKDLPKK